MVTIASKTNAHVYTEIPGNFLIPSTKNWLGEIGEISQDDNVNCHRAKKIIAFLQQRHKINKIARELSSDLN